jgi:uncharacterized repeat protein (TIGR04076 family)
MQKLKIVVENVKGECYAGYERGEVIEVDDPIVKGKICIYALSALIPYLTAACRASPSDWINSVEVLQCADPKNTVTFRIIREAE